LACIYPAAVGFDLDRVNLDHEPKSIPQVYSRNKKVEILYTRGILLVVAPEEVDQLISDLAAWCNAEYGRQTEIAEKLGVSKQLVSHWINKRKTPSLESFFKIREFLQKQKSGRKKAS
jgi:hypothetical protein